MDTNDITTRLRSLVQDDNKRSETARLRDIFNEVEATLRSGVSQADVLAELHTSGFTMTIASFKSALQRIRKRNQAAKPSIKPAVAASSAPVASVTKHCANTEQLQDTAGQINEKPSIMELFDKGSSPTYAIDKILKNK